VTAGFVLFRLADGRSLTVEDDDLRRIYEELWTLAAEPGAVSTAALLLHESRRSPAARQSVDLTPLQTDVLTRAIERLGGPG